MAYSFAVEIAHPLKGGNSGPTSTCSNTTRQKRTGATNKSINRLAAGNWCKQHAPVEVCNAPSRAKHPTRITHALGSCLQPGACKFMPEPLADSPGLSRYVQSDTDQLYEVNRTFLLNCFLACRPHSETHVMQNVVVGAPTFLPVMDSACQVKCGPRLTHLSLSAQRANVFQLGCPWNGYYEKVLSGTSTQWRASASSSEKHPLAVAPCKPGEHNTDGSRCAS